MIGKHCISRNTTLILKFDKNIKIYANLILHRLNSYLSIIIKVLCDRMGGKEGAPFFYTC